MEAPTWSTWMNLNDDKTIPGNEKTMEEPCGNLKGNVEKAKVDGKMGRVASGMSRMKDEVSTGAEEREH